MWNQNDTSELTKQKQFREQTYGYKGEGVGGGIDWESEIDMDTLLYLK